MANNTVKILGIDPGINHTGWALGVHRLDTQSTTIQNYGLIEAAALARKESKEQVKTFGNVFSLYLYEREMRALLKTVNPDYVACEDAFMHKFPQAFVSLKLCISVIQRVLYEDYGKILHLIPPMVAKLAVWGNGMAKKEAVQEGIRRLEDLTIKHTKQRPAESMVEHEADSIAILYTFVKNLLPDLTMQAKK